jgi:hypothetical protein
VPGKLKEVSVWQQRVSNCQFNLTIIGGEVFLEPA